MTGLSGCGTDAVDPLDAESVDAEGYHLYRCVDPSANEGLSQVGVGARNTVAVESTVPAQTTHALFEVYAYEDVVNDATAPGFAGHFADDAAFVVTVVAGQLRDHP